MHADFWAHTRVTLTSNQTNKAGRRRREGFCVLLSSSNSVQILSSLSRFRNSVCCGNPGEFLDSSFEFLHYLPGRASLFVNFDEFVEIPQLLFAPPFEPTPDLRTDLSVLLQNCTSVVQFVRNGDQ